MYVTTIILFCNTLGVALTGNPNYGIVMEAYPFVARKLLKEDRPEIQRALQQVLYSTDNGSNGLIRLVIILPGLLLVNM